MKAYTDITQSKKLAEILPIESADMFYNEEPDETYPKDIVDTKYPMVIRKEQKHYLEEYGIPCWSLAALLEVLPNETSRGENFVDDYQIDIRKYDGGDGTTWYQIAYGNDRGSSREWHDMINTGEKENIIDCCYQMIVWLKENDLL